MGVRTEARVISCYSAAFAVLCSFGCSHTETAERAYARAWAAYVSGDLAQAAAEASRGAKRFEQDSGPWFWNLRCLQAEALTALADRKGAESILRRAPLTGPGLDQAEARRKIDLATISNSKEAASLFAEARAAARDSEVLIRLNLAEGSRAFNQGQAATANELFQKALDVALQTGNTYQQGQALSSLCSSAKSMHRYEESISFGQRALEIATRIGARRTAGFAHGNLGSTFGLLGNFDAALEHEKQAVAIFEQIGARSNLMTHVGELGLIYDHEGDFAKAIEYYRRGFDLALQLGSERDAARLAWNIALTYIKQEQWDPAEEWNNRAAQLVAKTGNAKAGLPVERNRARIAWGRGRPEEAVKICNELLAWNPDEPFIRWESYYLLGVIDSAGKRYLQADRSFEAALKIISEDRSALADSNNRITLLSRLIPFYQAYVDTLVDQNDDAHALRVVESSRAQVLSERLGRELKAQQFPTLGSFQHAAASTQSNMLSFWLAPRRSFAWLITPKRVQRFELPGEAEIEKLVARYRETVEHSLRDPIASNDAAGSALWYALLEKIAPQIPKDAPLIVIPDGALHRLNLETAVAPAPRPHYWIEDVQMAVSPSITIASAERAAGARTQPAILLIGDPDYKGTAYEPLANAAAEIREIQSHFANWREQAYRGQQASPTAYRQANPGQFSLIHFAAHAEANYERPLESAVILSANGGHSKLFAHDVADIPIHADLVTISACRSAGTRAYAGEGLLGFAWAFLNAGAHAVIAGLWDVSDVSTSQLMDRLYAEIAAGREPAAALRDAKLAMLRGERYQKPFYWAPFQVYLGAAGRGLGR